MPLRRSLILAALLVSIAACKERPSSPPDVVALAGARQVTIGEFKRFLERSAGTDLAGVVPEAASALLDQYLEEIVLAEYAATRGFEPASDRVAAAVRATPGSTASEKRDELRRDALLGDLAVAAQPPSEEQVQAYYRQYVSEFQLAERVRLSQILVRDEALARRIVDQLKQGADFAGLATKHSEAPNASNGGDVGFITRTELPRHFEEPVFSLKTGEFTDVIRTDTGFYIFRVTDRKEAGALVYEAAAPVIRQRLAEDASRKQISGLILEARQKIPVTILTRRLPFAYSGNFPVSAE